jgi:hypothetical protein
MSSCLLLISWLMLILLAPLYGQVVFSRRVYKEQGQSYQQIWNWNPADNNLRQLTDSPRDHYLPSCSGSSISFISPAPWQENAKEWIFDRGSLTVAPGQSESLGRRRSMTCANLFWEAVATFGPARDRSKPAERRAKSRCPAKESRSAGYESVPGQARLVATSQSNRSPGLRAASGFWSPRSGSTPTAARLNPIFGSWTQLP